MAADLGMYCENKIYGVYLISMYFGGYLFGAGSSGMLGNWIGRKHTSMLLTSVSSVLLIANVIV